jgi:hypothetical protein
MSFARSGIAILLALVCSSLSVAGPIEYRLQMTFGHDGFETPHPVLVGATLKLTFRFDASSLAPTKNDDGGSSYGWITKWPTNNTVMTATVLGTASSDGTFAGVIDAITPTDWEFASEVTNLAGKDRISFPRTQFPFNGGLVRISAQATFDDLFGNATSTIYPVAFSDGVAAWDADYRTTNPAHRSAMQNLAGTAVFVPESHTAVTSLLGTIGLAAMLRRR